jgi:hypothetical protein
VTAVVPRMTRRIAFWLAQEGGPDGAPYPLGGAGHDDGPASPSLSGLVFLFLADDQRSDGSSGWRRGRKVLRDVEAKLAATPGITYRVRALPGRDAGALRRPRLTAWISPGCWPVPEPRCSGTWPCSGRAAR